MAPSLGKYDQVLAITQQLLNTGLRALWAKGSQEPIKSVGDHELKLTNFIFDAPKVVIPDNPESTNRSKVLMIIRIKSGKLMYWVNEDDDEPAKISAAGWAFAVPTDLELQDITDPDELAKMRSQLDIPGDYTVSRLMVSMRKAAVQDLDRKFSHFTVDISNSKIASLARFLCQPDGVLDKQLSTLGYVSLTNDPNQGKSHPPTFKPTGLRFQTSSWIHPESKKPAGTGTSGNSILNYLCYNESTDDRALPSGPDAWLYPQDNWTPGEATGSNDDANLVLGRFYISKQNFFEKWLIPKLSVLNELVHISVRDQYCGAWAIPVSYQWKTKIQLCSLPDATSATWLLKPSGDHSWNFQLDHDLGGKDEQGALSIQCKGSASGKPGAPYHRNRAIPKLIKYINPAHNSSTLSYRPGSNRITFEGNSDVKLYVHVWWGNQKEWVINKADRIDRTLRWRIDLDLESVSDGGLQIKFTPSLLEYVKDADEDELGYIGYLRQWLNDEVPNFMMSQISNFEGQLAKELSQLHKLYFPAGGVFFYKNPIITENGDLAADVLYSQDASEFPGRERKADMGMPLNDTPLVNGDQNPVVKVNEG